MLSITVTNPTIQRLLLEHVIETIETEDGFDALLKQGCSAEFLDLLRRRPARDLITVANTLKSSIRYSISTKEVVSQLQHLDRVRRDDQLREYFVLHGASRTLLNEYFRMSGDEVRRMRELLLPAGVAQCGRTPLPPPKVRDEIHLAWSAINKQHPDDSQRERMYRLHQQFPSMTIDTLNETVQEFSERSSRRRTGPSGAVESAPRINSDTAQPIPGVQS